MESFNIYRSNIYGSIHIFDRFWPFWWWWTLSILDFATHSFVYNTVYVFLCVWLNVCQVFFCCFFLLSIIIILKNYSVNRSNLWERKQSTLFVPSSSTTTTTARWFLSFFFHKFPGNTNQVIEFVYYEREKFLFYQKKKKKFHKFIINQRKKKFTFRQIKSITKQTNKQTKIKFWNRKQTNEQQKQQQKYTNRSINQFNLWLK